MARDLYGEMLSRALNRGAPPGHFPAYINPGEAAQLRAQGGGVPPGGGQYVANGLPSYQSPADWQAAAVSDYGQQGPQLESPPTYTMPDSDFTFTQPDVRDEFARQRDLAVAREAFREQVAALTAAPPREVPIPLQQEAKMHLSQEYLEDLPWRENPNLFAAQLAQRTAKAENAKDQIKQNAAVAKVKNSFDYNENTPEGEAAIIAAMNANRLTHTNAELSALNFEIIINDGRLTPEEMASRLSANISEGGIGKHAPAAGAARRGVDRGYGDDPNLKDTLRSLTLLTPEGEYAVMGGGVSMPRELMSFIPALAGSAASFILPPAAGAALTLGSLGLNAPMGLSQYVGARYGHTPLYQSVAGSPLGNLLGMRSGEERALPEIDLANIRRMAGRGRTGGGLDVPMDEGELAEREFAEREAERELAERELDDAGPFAPDQRPTDPISQVTRDTLEEHRRDSLIDFRQRQEALASLLNPPRQFA